MDRAKAMSNLCRIYHRQNDEEKLVFGCGCVVKCSDQSLKIATSEKIRELTGGEVFAKFEAIQDKEIKLQVDAEEEGEKRGIAYVSFDETAFEELPEGLLMANLIGIDEIACRVPVFEKLEQFGGISEIEHYNVVKDQTGCTLQMHAGNNNRVIKSLRESDKFHLLVRGAPILDGSFKFFGIVDFVLVGEESLLELVYHGIQQAPTGMYRRCDDIEMSYM